MQYGTGQLADIAAIRAVARRYARGLDRLDPDLVRDAYWPDAIDEHGYFNGSAMDLVPLVIKSQSRWRSTMHCILNHMIDLEPDGRFARGEIVNVSYLFGPEQAGQEKTGQEKTGPEAAGRADGCCAIWWGRYLDRYEKRGDTWRIIHRVNVHDRTAMFDESPMEFPLERFRDGAFDRGVA